MASYKSEVFTSASQEKEVRLLIQSLKEQMQSSLRESIKYWKEGVISVLSENREENTEEMKEVVRSTKLDDQMDTERQKIM